VALIQLFLKLNQLRVAQGKYVTNPSTAIRESLFDDNSHVLRRAPNKKSYSVKESSIAYPNFTAVLDG